ncbi:bifunctional diguanylate cyclase/phosphodiesterase [Noviherbaspirillum cavernae]|nr:EAL domain-containing protein [Noviherbaspirillum cavernae]
MAMATSYLANIRERLAFLSGNYRLAAVWPIVALISGIVGWNFLLSGLNADRESLETHALREAEAMARRYADQVTRTVEAIDQITLHVRYDWKLSNGKLQLDDAKAEGLFPPTSIFFVAVIDRNDMLITGTLPPPKNRFLGNTEDFLAQKAATEDFLYVGASFVGPVSGRNTIPFTRRLLDQDGSFDGIVVVSVSPDYFTSSYNEAILGKNGLLGIVGDDHKMRVTRIGHTVHSANVHAFVSVPRFAPQKSGSAVLNGNEWFADKRSRYVGWHAVERYPLIAMAGLDAQDMLTPYRENRAAAIRTALGATLALAVFTLIAMILSLRLAWRKHQLEMTRTTYRMATEGGNEGFYISRPIRDVHGAIVDFMTIDCNQRGAELFLHRREELIGKTISTLYDRTPSDRIIKLLCLAMEAGSHETELEVPGESPFTGRWAHLKAIRSDGDLAVTLRDISDTKAHVAELERRSNEDALTGLPNRHWVQTSLPTAIEHAAANNDMLAALFIDLDGFKAVNDTLGHEAGDEVLRNAARRLKVAVRPHDCVARLGGDEFVVILERIAQKADAAHVAERILHAFQDGFHLLQGVHAIGTSIGISIFPTDGTDSETLLRNADIAMYSVKTSGKRNYRFYDEKFHDALRARLEREAELRHAIGHDQLVMHYQPRVDISTGTTSSMEALVRWAHPSRGVLEPLEFIPLAEETGLILDLGALVIDKVCAQLACWAQRGQQLVPVSINVSPRQFNETDVAKILSTSLARHNVDPRLIEIELTESSMMGDSHDVANALTAIQKMGIKLLVDDFGTGYSSLSQLQRLDFDVLKVDRAFTSGLERTGEGNVFFKAIITMAHALGMRVVAEGVETLEQIRILKSLKCDEIQGFYISRPLPPSDTQPILPRWFFPSTA